MLVFIYPFGENGRALSELNESCRPSCRAGLGLFFLRTSICPGETREPVLPPSLRAPRVGMGEENDVSRNGNKLIFPAPLTERKKTRHDIVGSPSLCLGEMWVRPQERSRTLAHHVRKAQLSLPSSARTLPLSQESHPEKEPRDFFPDLFLPAVEGIDRGRKRLVTSEYRSSSPPV